MHLLIMGAPGSGKGTYASRIKNYFGIPHISTGDMFREAMKNETPTGLLAKGYIDKGMLVPDEVTNQLVKERLSMADCKKGFLLDGYPRNLEQAEVLNEILKELNINLTAAINLQIEDEKIINRIVNRRMCTNCGKGYNLISLKPKQENVCDDCGAPLYQRKDDNVETISNRLSVYNMQTKPLIAYYENKGIVMNIDSDDSIENVVEKIIKQLEDK